MNHVVLAAVLSLWGALHSVTALACEGGFEHYLRWNTDHTERDIRPAYPVSSEQAARLPAYRICRNGAGQVVEASFFLYAKPSDRSEFGTHQVTITRAATFIERVYRDQQGEIALNSRQVAVERYSHFENGLPSKKEHFGVDATTLTNDSTGTSTLVFQRDEFGRRIIETRYDTAGELVPEHNGFEQAHFAFDANDYARYRRGYDRHGQPMTGPAGYHTAYFWFNEQGTFTAEEFRDLQGQPALFPPGDYFRVEFHEID
ncbi:MAG: hypothetical protein AAFX85_11205, partial [Pseudomonadota bacterium]